MPEDVSFPRFSRPGSSPPTLACTQLARKNDAATGSFCTRLFSPVSSCLYLPCLYLPCLYIALVFISPLFLYLPCFYISLVFISPPNPGPLTLLYSQFPSTHSRPRHLTRHAASANQGSRGKSPPNWIHLNPGTPAQHSRCLCLI
ncbi:mCG1035458 [Mus musculus]|nr:mCG1035458 [Mus musculus]